MFGFAEDSEGVRAEDLFDVGFGVFAIEKFLGDDGVAGDVGEVGGKLGNAVVIATKPDVIDAGDFHDVVYVIDEVFDCAGRHWIFSTPGAKCGGVFLWVRMFLLKVAGYFKHVLHDASGFRDDEAGEEVHHDDAAVLFEAQENVVWDIAGVLGN